MKIKVLIGIAFLLSISSCGTQNTIDGKLTNKNNSQSESQLESPAIKARASNGNRQPPYPKWDLFWGNTGETKFSLHLGIDGKIKAIHIKESTASNSLNNSFIEWAPKNWFFIPCQNSKKEPVECIQEFTYRWLIYKK